MTDIRPHNLDPALDPDVPIPNPGLDKLRSQMHLTTRLAFLVTCFSLLAIAVLALFDAKVTLFGSMLAMLTTTAFLGLGIMMKRLYVIRGGTLTRADLATLLAKIWALLPALVASYWLMVAHIQQYS